MRMTLFAFLALFASFAAAQPYAILTEGASIVTLNDDKCTLPFLSGDYHTATWKEGSKTFTGCWGINSLGIVIIWTDDKAMSAIPGKHFKRAEDI